MFSAVASGITPVGSFGDSIVVSQKTPCLLAEDTPLAEYRFSSHSCQQGDF